ncbi:hypothetical protein OUZ56_009707 [Daphnia magna]|uniref:Uncharacterized protein n=1 Tax=Daphnia magna TaxID=35525 RepID=A0ABR0AGR4_9CRUS|nr:hypothetical protein OUZ56_009707 [Daphnia magna]
MLGLEFSEELCFNPVTAGAAATPAAAATAGVSSQSVEGSRAKEPLPRRPVLVHPEVLSFFLRTPSIVHCDAFVAFHPVDSILILPSVEDRMCYTGGRWAIAAFDAVRGLIGDPLPDSLSSAETTIDDSLDGSSGLRQPCESEFSQSSLSPLRWLVLLQPRFLPTGLPVRLPTFLLGRCPLFFVETEASGSYTYDSSSSLCFRSGSRIHSLGAGLNGRSLETLAFPPLLAVKTSVSLPCRLLSY